LNDNIGVITLAYGLPKFIEMAKTLARSLRLHSPGINLCIATDKLNDNEINQLFDIVLPINKEYGSNVRQKLYLDKYSPYTKTLFIDSDCVAVRDVNFIFDQLSGTDFTVPGSNYLVSGDTDPFVNVDKVLMDFKVDRVPKFNGGLYYFEKNEKVAEFFKTARDLLSNSSDLGFYEFRGDGAADEPIIAVSMVLHNMNMWQDQGAMMRTPIGLKGPLRLDVLNGFSTFKKGDEIVSPAVVHFAGSCWNAHPIYLRESLKLRQMTAGSTISDDQNVFYIDSMKYGYWASYIEYYMDRLFETVKRIF
jgi:hypothetical protein